jgi:CheY-like chemotaxis protein
MEPRFGLEFSDGSEPAPPLLDSAGQPLVFESVQAPTLVPTQVATPRPRKPTQNIMKRKVLLVEDDVPTTEIYRILLEKEFFEVEIATNGLKALESVYRCTPDLILCDLMLPEMSGVEVVTELRSDPRTRHIPVMMMTVSSSEENELMGIQCGADDFVCKMMKKNIMMARVNRLLNRVAPD